MKHSDKNYEDFSLSLALFDALPVIFFSAAMLVIALRFKNALFIAGALLCTFAGIGKVLWKILIAGTKKNIMWLNRQLRIVMPSGFLLLLAGALSGRQSIDFHALTAAIVSFPAVLLFGITVLGMLLMGIFAFRLDPTKSRSNWIEQITNAIAQGCLLIGVLLCTFFQ